MKTSLKTLAASLVLSVALTGCLKSRLQLREDGADDQEAKPVPGKVEPVQPQGGYAVDELKGEMTRLTGRIEELERAKPDPAAATSQKDEFKKLQTRMTELENAQAQMIEALKKLQESQAATVQAMAETPAGYEKAKARFDQNDYDGAIELFTSYLKNPKAPKFEDATFYRGEAYFSTKQFKKAIVDFSRFPEKYTKSKHMAAALLKIGQSFEAMGMKDDAKGFYQELAEKYPKTAEAKKARAKLK